MNENPDWTDTLLEELDGRQVPVKLDPQQMPHILVAKLQEETSEEIWPQQ